MLDSQEIEKRFDADNGENIGENIEEIELEIEPVSATFRIIFTSIILIQSDVKKSSTD